MRSFTLMEIVIAFIILAILVSLAFAFFMKAIERARVKEAITNLKLIQAAEHIKHLEFYQFYTCSTPVVGSDPNCTSELDLAESLPTNNWTYVVTSSDTATDFTVTASRVSGHWSECQYSLTDTVNSRNDPQAVDAAKCVSP